MKGINVRSDEDATLLCTSMAMTFLPSTSKDKGFSISKSIGLPPVYNWASLPFVAGASYEKSSP